MKPCPAALASFLADPSNEACVQLDLYTFYLISGETFRYTSGDSTVTVPASGFPSDSTNVGADRTFLLGPMFARSKVKNQVGIQPAELDIDIFADSSILIGNRSLADVVRLGFFDGASVELDRFFAPLTPTTIGVDTSLGCLVWFYGRVADTDIGRSKVTLKVKSLTNLLAVQQMPRRLYQATCNHIFGDAMCGYDRVGGRNALGVSTGVGAVTVVALAGSTQDSITTSFVPSPSFAYDQGTLIGLSGLNVGSKRAINTIAGSVVSLRQTLFDFVKIGDQFQLLPGCNHTIPSCNGYLQNFLRYGGFAYIPPPELSV